MSNDCLFCEIISSKISANIVDETKNLLAFQDINPQAPVHILIIPKMHIASCNDLNENNIHYISEMALMARRISDAENILKHGYRWVINTGNNGGQTVDHIHLHLLGGRNMAWPPG